jgi:signal transduction histidine kinase
MIQKLRRKFVLIVMVVVAIILLGIFFTMLMTTQNNNEQMSITALYQALSTASSSNDIKPPSRPSFRQGPSPQMRLPVLIVGIDNDGNISIISNQLHFIEESDIGPIVELALNKTKHVGTLSNYALRYLRGNTKNGLQIAFIDISIEQEILKIQIINSLFIGGLAILCFFILSIFLARWAVRPVEIAWEQQKQFIADASHELKTPLTVILSNADILCAEKNLGDDKNMRRMEHIHAEAVRMKQLVGDMLILAQSDSGERVEAYSLVDFSYIVKSAVLMYEPIIYDDNKKLVYEIEDNLFVKGDLQRLSQAIYILLDNALKYSSSKGTIEVNLKKAENKNLLLSVSNDGNPIPKEELEKIFLRFYRRDESRSRHGSFGLGLSIAQGIINDHRGKIWAESDGKSVNTFCISLPPSK